jgi:hypothetical protein
MKRIVLMTAVSAGLLVPSAAFVSNAGAENPHNGTPPGQGGDANAGCDEGSPGGKPSGDCQSANLPFSNGCNSSSSPHNPHCEGTQGTPTTSPSVSAPTAPAPAGGAAGAEKQGAANPANQKAARAAQGGGGNLPFTGLDAMWLALLGAGLLVSGLALWARSWLGLAAN